MYVPFCQRSICEPGRLNAEVLPQTVHFGQTCITLVLRRSSSLISGITHLVSECSEVNELIFVVVNSVGEDVNPLALYIEAMFAFDYAE